jgi:hypothetical protein
MSIILDTGALVALDRGDRRIAVLIDEASKRDVSILTSAACVAQAWRGSGTRQARLAISLRGIEERGIDASISKALGQLSARSGIDDIVDVHVASLVRQGDVLATSDGGDLSTLLRALHVGATIVHC